MGRFTGFNLDGWFESQFSKELIYIQLDLLAGWAAILLISKGEGWVEAIPEAYFLRFR
ncbi:MAG: hypothetical protein LHW56_07570 [Candidatus Cloacimonetes bacterium]|nr:hypothetical protein [Candidatus Cloacimonadota bacterium]MDY0172753.1 hypothetical protein [Candidatus Cloacimonadaceae bacterium]